MSDTGAGDTGYRRPPKHSRFQKGQSGNPGGRPRRNTSFKTDLAAELQQKLTITENGKRQKITKQRAVVKMLIAAALKTDIRAANVLFAFARQYGVGIEEQEAEPVDIDDLDSIDAIVQKERQRQGRSKSENAGSKPEDENKDATDG